MELDVVDGGREKAYQIAIVISLISACLPLVAVITWLLSVGYHTGHLSHQLQNVLLCELDPVLQYLSCSGNPAKCRWQNHRKIRDLPIRLVSPSRPDNTVALDLANLRQASWRIAEEPNVLYRESARKIGTESDKSSELSSDSELMLMSTQESAQSTTELLQEFLTTYVTTMGSLKTTTPQASRNEECSCTALPGPKGVPGRKGMKGAPGAQGAPGYPGRLPCEPPLDLKKICADPCPVGKQGIQGPTGPPGDKGVPGVPGARGRNGENGKTGPPGPRGPPGIPGLDGDLGDPGVDAVPAPFIPGPPGPAGDAGPVGPPGPRGMPGIDGPPGPQGKRGEPGENGLAGKTGLPGLPGPIGKAGPDGNAGICPTYCATDGGVFFVKPPDWFVD
ncbi:unnamed protein product [Gongylonema pulchrum]|uniref:Col_cuticle_N domain-containing protein n=1 Tax=Gongylonema pulchrum TaxID=637853 RepID=A0A183DW30_9BILA|nr:unnamed protein product [Gongylonema pulchrum]